MANNAVHLCSLLCPDYLARARFATQNTPDIDTDNRSTGGTRYQAAAQPQRAQNEEQQQEHLSLDTLSLRDIT